MAVIPPRFDYQSIKDAIAKTGAAKIVVSLPKDAVCLRSWVKYNLKGYGTHYERAEGVAYIIPAATPVKMSEIGPEPVKAEPISLEEAGKYRIEQKWRRNYAVYNQIMEIVKAGKIASVTTTNGGGAEYLRRKFYPVLYVALKKSRRLDVHIVVQKKADRLLVVPNETFDKLARETVKTSFTVEPVSSEDAEKAIGRKSRWMYTNFDLTPIQKAILDTPAQSILKVTFDPEKVPVSTFANTLYVWATRNGINLTMRKFADGVFFVGIAEKSYVPPVIKLKSIEAEKAIEELRFGKEVEVKVDRLNVWGGFGGWTGRGALKRARAGQGSSAGVHSPAGRRGKVVPDDHKP